MWHLAIEALSQPTLKGNNIGVSEPFCEKFCPYSFPISYGIWEANTQVILRRDEFLEAASTKNVL